MPEDLTWRKILAAPRTSAALIRERDIPKKPGVYAWFNGDACVYLGMATSLRERLGKHRSLSLDLSRSTLRASVAVRELGVTRAHARSRPSAMSKDQVDVVTEWLHGSEIAWLECETPKSADDLERQLRTAWLPPLNLV